MPPHLFAVSDEAYRNMINGQTSWFFMFDSFLINGHQIKFACV